MMASDTWRRLFPVGLVVVSLLTVVPKPARSESGACKVWNDEVNDVWLKAPFQNGAQKVPGVRAPYPGGAMDIRQLKYSIDGENLRIDIRVADVTGPANPVTERINYVAFVLAPANYPYLDPRNNGTTFAITATRDHGNWTFAEGQNSYSSTGDLVFPPRWLEGSVDTATNTISIFKPLRDINLSQGTVLRDIHAQADDRVAFDAFPSNGAYSGSAFRFDVAGACPQ